MICTVVNGVDTDGINLELLEPVYVLSDVFHHPNSNCGSYSAISRVHVALSAIGSTASDEPPEASISNDLAAKLKECLTRLVVYTPDVETIVTSKESCVECQHPCL